MVTITVNGQAVEVSEGSTVLEAAAAAGVRIPTLCYLKDLNCIGSCRVCLVDVEGEGLVASCNTAVREGMAVRTDTPQVAAARRANLQAIMDDHRALCATCVRQDTCALRFLSSTFNLADAPGPLPEPAPWDADFPLQRDSSKCIKCMRCVAICEKVQHCAVWDYTGVGPSTKIIVRDNLPIAEAGCALCGQCITHCPTGALTARDDVSLIMEAILDPTVETVVQVAPAVRTAWGEGLGLSREEATPGRLAAALHAVGFDKVFDTDFAADLTIMEEGSEFVEFLGSDASRPMFTSCCPGWVRFVKQHYPQFTAQLSSAKSPHQMMGAVVKNTLAAEADEVGRRLFVVSIMPCVAKKSECTLPTMRGEDGIRPCTPQGIVRLLKSAGIALDGARAVVIGRSNIVGKPAALMLTQENCTVTLCHSHTRDLAQITRQADILVAAVGKPRFVTADMVKPGAVVIDVGINRTPDGLLGDVLFDEVQAKASAITPVPGGVGPMTIIMLMENTIEAAERAAQI